MAVISQKYLNRLQLAVTKMLGDAPTAAQRQLVHEILAKVPAEIMTHLENTGLEFPAPDHPEWRCYPPNIGCDQGETCQGGVCVPDNIIQV